MEIANLKNPKKMLILADGASIHTVKWIQGLSLSGNWELYLVSMNPAPFHEKLSEIPQLKETIRCAPKKINEAGNNYQYIFQVPKIIQVRRRIMPDVINSVYLSSYGVVAAMIKGPVRLCHFVIGDDVMVTPDKNWLLDRLTKFALSRADFVISASQTMADKIVHRWHFAQQNILTQQYGLSDAILEYPSQDKTYDFVSNRMWIPNSNIDWLLKTMETLESPFKFALVGGAVKGNEHLAEKITQLAGGLPGVIPCGVLPYEKNIEAIARSRFLISVTASDGASISLLEAMALGAVPIVSDTSPNREWVEHGHNGFIIPLNDATQAAKIIEQARATSEDELDRMRRINHEIIRKRGSLKTNMTRLLDRLEWPLSKGVAVI